MSSEDIRQRYQEVTINLMSGETLEGYLLGFSPLMRTFHFFEKSSAATHEESRKIDCEQIVYVGLHPCPGTTAEVGHNPLDLDELKVITVNQDYFHVLALPTMTNTPGFFAIDRDDELPYERIFFYQHGIRYQEKPERLGDLLIDQEVITDKEVEEALKIQAESLPSIGEVLVEQGKLDDEGLDFALKTQQMQRMKFGDLLVHQELVSEDDVEQALEEQKQDSDLPLGHFLQEQGKIKADHIESALKVQQRSKMRLGEILVEAGLITDEDIQMALEEQKVRGQRLGEILLGSQLITEGELLDALAAKFRLPTVDLDTYEINALASNEIERKVIEKYGILPIDSDDHSITIALADPMGLEAYDGICFKTGKKVHEVMCKASQLSHYIEQLLNEEENDGALAWDFQLQESDDTNEAINEIEMTQSAEDAPIVSLVNQIIRNGLRKKASDIHILPQSNKVVLAYRQNGQLISETALDYGLRKQISARIKILCGMDISEQRLPQDGRLLLRDGARKYEFRVSCIPNTFGESMVLRVLNKDMAVELGSIGLRSDDIDQLSALVRKPYGLILVTGPTGSGKSTTLFAVLQSISHLPAHILTVEDPVESEVPGANQIQVNHKIGMSFARILRNVLRHDPDIIMIGEMRDPETAEIGIEAALTGHLMFSTLHTNSAVDTIIRLNDLGIPNYLIAPALLGVISQNLMKQLCPECRAELDRTDPAYAMVGDMGFAVPDKLYRAVGCESCHHTGYAGRVMSYEFLAVNEKVRQAIHDGVKGTEMHRIAVESGMVPKSEGALKMAAEGIIDCSEFIHSVM